MKLIISTKKRKEVKEYVVRIANHVDPDVEEIVNQLKVEIDPKEKVTAYALYGDGFYSPLERQQLDFEGQITKSPTEIPLEILCPSY